MGDEKHGVTVFGEGIRALSVRMLVAATLAVEPGRIGLHAAAHRTAHQAVHRQAEVPALEVPQRHIDGAQCLDGQPLLAMITQGCRDSANEARSRTHPYQGEAAL